jgi:hypothetical protein
MVAENMVVWRKSSDSVTTSSLRTDFHENDSEESYEVGL